MRQANAALRTHPAAAQNPHASEPASCCRKEQGAGPTLNFLLLAPSPLRLPTLRDVRSVGTTAGGSWSFWLRAVHLFQCRPHAVTVTNQQAVEVRDAHLPKIAEGG